MTGRPADVADVVVVGGGITGLAAAHHLATRAPHLRVTLVETGPRLGGKIRTEHVDGFVVEGGPDSLMISKPALARLLGELGVDSGMQAPQPGPTLVSRGGRLVPVPDGLNGFVPRRIGPLALSRLFSPSGKVRMGLELFVPVRRGGADESLAGFVTRRLGRQAYERMAEPLAGGIFGADPARLSLLATMPHLRAAEIEHRGLVRSVLAQRRRSPGRTRGQGTGRTAPGAPAMARPALGMGELVAALTARLGSTRVLTQTALTSVREGPDGFLLTLEGGGVTTSLRADAVVLAVPAPAASVAVAALDPALGSCLAAFATTSTVTVSLGFRSDDLVRRPPGHGYLVPVTEGRPARAVTWSSAKHPGCAPAGHELFRVSLGGAGRPSLDHLDEAGLATLARRELADVLGLDAEPVLTRVHRWREVMPQYSVGHLDQVRGVEDRLRAHPGVVVAGSAFHGMGVPDCVASGQRAATAVEDLLSGRAAASAPS